MGTSTVTSSRSRDPEIPALGSYALPEGSSLAGAGAHWQFGLVKAPTLWSPIFHTIKATFGEGSTLQHPKCTPEWVCSVWASLGLSFPSYKMGAGFCIVRPLPLCLNSWGLLPTTLKRPHSVH